MNGRQISINDPSIPKIFRKKAKLVGKLISKHDLDGLRKLRDTSLSFGIEIYHHSAGTDSYYHDLDGKYYYWAQVEAKSNEKLEKGEHFATAVIPYRAGILFTKSSLAPDISLN